MLPICSSGVDTDLTLDASSGTFLGLPFQCGIMRPGRGLCSRRSRIQSADPVVVCELMSKGWTLLCELGIHCCAHWCGRVMFAGGKVCFAVVDVWISGSSWQ